MYARRARTLDLLDDRGMEMVRDIAWGEPLLPQVSDPAWEATVKRRAGSVADIYRRVAPLPWLREACLRVDTYRSRYMPVRLLHIGAMVIAQENACRYCYGAARAYLRVLGYREATIARMERETHLAELDDRDREFIQFARKLARSNPRPARAERNRLIELGYSPEAVTEMAFFIAFGCFYNRVTTLLACPPETGFERFSESWAGRLLALGGPITRPLAARKRRAARTVEEPVALPAGTPFASIINELRGLPAAAVVQRTLTESFASPVLSTHLKALLFAVVARTLECTYCQDQARALGAEEGPAGAEFQSAVAALYAPDLPPQEAAILNWVRDTVHYQPATIQQQTRRLAEAIGSAAVLEAVGMASLANGVVRLAMLLE